MLRDQAMHRGAARCGTASGVGKAREVQEFGECWETKPCAAALPGEALHQEWEK